MPKPPPNRKPDPSPLTVPQRANLSRHQADRPTPSLPTVRWLDREVGEKQKTENGK